MTVVVPVSGERLNIQVIGKYEPVGILGKGGESYVLDGRDLCTGEQCAIKVLFGYGDDAGAEEYVKAIKRLRSAREAFREIGPHDHIVKFLDSGDSRIEDIIGGMEVRVPCYFNVYEKVDLYDEKGGVPEGLMPGQVAIAGAETASALIAMHVKGWVHRDTKPANMFIDKEGHVHLGDLGLAYKMNERTGHDGTVRFTPGIPASMRENETWAATLFGTPAYMSPEQAAGQFVGPESDTYNLGAALYTMLAGRIPHDGKDAMTLLFSAKHEPVTPLKAVRPDVPQSLHNVVMKMMEKQPEDRGDLRELEEELRKASEEPWEPVRPARTKASTESDVTQRVVRPVKTFWNLWGLWK